MLGDYEIDEFEQKWENLISEFSLQENIWVLDMYAKHNMWVAAHIRGNFFAGFRKIYRCEGLHSFLGRYVNYENNLLEFSQHIFRAMSYMRYKEVEADFSSAHGEPVLQTQLQDLEKSIADIYTREIFYFLRPLLQRACTCRVTHCAQTTFDYTYTVCKYRRQGLEWKVSFFSSSLEFKCSCKRMEPLGVPCEHIICVLVYLDIVVIPKCLVMSRWTKKAKDSVYSNENKSSTRDPTLISQYVGIVEHCKKMAHASVFCGKPEYVRNTIDLVLSQTQMLEALNTSPNIPHAKAQTPIETLLEGSLRNPSKVRTKGCGASSSMARGKEKEILRKAHKCGVFKREGHNRKSCPLMRQSECILQTQYGSNVEYQDEVLEDIEE
ncbi:protein FAR1-RELATED SEQUENCE 5-like [Vicia villosa]|uniref:protein FAR1-RELATED SEQUENCE 5-like n=1 Tax=Vicia villosa TaxID=3911 RepID=UPI00273C8BA4|nr:protein FAR1-RELATED SEQUENCE 5-like [Vicia villosa]